MTSNLTELTQKLSPEEAERLIAEQQRKIGRQCGSMCCLIPLIEALDKPADTWCRHCDPGGQRCRIYADRPPVCRKFVCVWLVNPSFSEAWYPLRAKIVVQTIVDAAGPIFQFNVDKRYPQRWREQPYWSDIRRIAANGSNFGYRVSIVCGDKQWMIRPDGEIVEAPGDKQ